VAVPGGVPGAREIARRASGAPREWRLRTGWSDDDWDRILEEHREATFFHTRIWSRVVLRSFPQVQDRSMWLETGSGTVLVPLFRWSRAGGLVSTLHSSFPFLYGGPVPCRGPDGEDRTAPALARIRTSLASVRVTGNPFALPLRDEGSADPAVREPGPPEPPVLGAPGFALRTERTHLMPLPGFPGEYWDGVLTTTQRNDVRRLGRKGVAIEETRAAEAADAVHALYLRSFERWGGRPAMVYPRAFYRNLLLLGGPAVRLTIARHEGRLLGGTFAIRWNGIVHYLAGYFDHESRSLRPNVLIQIESIRKAIEDGFRLYDFLPSGGHESVTAFKEGLGGRAADFPVYERAGIPHRLLRGIRRG
jgi:hypothetical protein